MDGEWGARKISIAPITIVKLRGIFAMNGLPVLVVSDNGPCFSSPEFSTFMKVNGIRHIFPALFQPSSNWQAECSMHTFKEALKKMKTVRKVTLKTNVNRFLFTYSVISLLFGDINNLYPRIFSPVVSSPRPIEKSKILLISMLFLNFSQSDLRKVMWPSALLYFTLSVSTCKDPQHVRTSCYHHHL